jgi:DNA mismatch repair protein MSH3
VVVVTLAELDCLLGLARLATQPGYCKPNILDCDGGTATITIENGCNPVVTALLDDCQFVPNDTSLSNESDAAKRCYVITGPNMGGTSRTNTHTHTH